MIGDFFVVWCKFKNWQWHHLQDQTLQQFKMKVRLEFRVFVRPHLQKSCRSSKDLVQQQKEEIQRLRQESEEQTHRNRYQSILWSIPQKTDWYLYNLVFIIRHLGILKWNQRPSCALKNHLLSRWFRSPIVGLAWWEVRNDEQLGCISTQINQ